jgi:hypothetical protein
MSVDLKPLAIRVLALVALGLHVHAATVIAAGTKSVAACGFAVNPAAEIVNRLQYPMDWKVIVVCNEIVWDTLMRQSSVNFVSKYAFTFRRNRVTFVRAKVFLERMTYTPEQVLDHELGHIACHCEDEEAAWKRATRN